MAANLETKIKQYGTGNLKAFLMFMNSDKLPEAKLKSELTDWASKSKLDKVAVTYILTPTDSQTAGLYKINPDKQVKNTVFVYSGRRVKAKFVNFSADKKGIDALNKAIDEMMK